MPSAPEPRFDFALDPDAEPGDAIPALAALLLAIVDRQDNAEPPAAPPQRVKRRRPKRAPRAA